jgi:hypothetical protein
VRGRDTERRREDGRAPAAGHRSRAEDLQAADDRTAQRPDQEAEHACRKVHCRLAIAAGEVKEKPGDDETECRHCDPAKPSRHRLPSFSRERIYR